MNPPKQTLMPIEKIIQLLSVLNKTRIKLQTIMSGTMSVTERSNEIENVADTVTGLEEGTWCYLPVVCLTTQFEVLWNRIRTARQEILDQSRDDRQDRVLRQPVENLQESRIPKDKHRPECQTR